MTDDATPTENLRPETKAELILGLGRMIEQLQYACCIIALAHYNPRSHDTQLALKNNSFTGPSNTEIRGPLTDHGQPPTNSPRTVLYRPEKQRPAFVGRYNCGQRHSEIKGLEE